MYEAAQGVYPPGSRTSEGEAAAYKKVERFAVLLPVEEPLDLLGFDRTPLLQDTPDPRLPRRLPPDQAEDPGVRLHHGGPQGAKPKSEVVADIRASIKERRA